MEIRKIKLSSGMAYGQLPDSLVEMCDREKTLTYVAVDDYNSIFGLAIFTKSLIAGRELVLRYIFVEDEVRRMGIGKAILSYAFEDIKKLGVIRVVTRVFGDEEDQFDAYALFSKVGFEMLPMGGHFIHYTLAEIKQSLLAAQQSKLEPVMKRVKFFSQIPKHERKSFLVKAMEEGYSFDFQSVDRLFATFYMEGNEIKGYMNLKEISENVILLSDIYIDESVNAALTITAMLGTMIKISCAIMPDDTQFLFQLYDNNEFNGFLKAFGEKDEDIMIREYVKEL